jgi:uncharacterized protein (TIGR03663 family)
MSFVTLNSTRKRVPYLMCCLAALFCGLVFKARMAGLEQRPMHGDEANQAVRAGVLLEQGVYHYDPVDHHGPVLYYAAMPFCRASTRTFSETNEINFRMVPVCFSIVTLVLMLGLYRRDGKGLFYRPIGALMALVFVAVSPAMNYYSRFFIQETMFVTFLTGVLVCAVRYVGNESSGAKMAYAAGLGCSLGLALATKETVVLSIAAACIASVCTCGFRRIRDAWSLRDALIVVGVAGGVAFLFYSSFFTYPRGAYDAVFSTMGTYFNRATAVPEHHHAWNYYLTFLLSWQYGRGPVWSEIGTLLALPILIAVLVPVARWIISKVRKQPEMCLTIHMKWTVFVAIYTLVLMSLYSFIPYKTPWCILSFLHGFLLLAAIGFDTVYHGLRNTKIHHWRLNDIGVVVLCIGVGVIVNMRLKQSTQACFKLAADIRNPYVYAHTGMDALKLVDAVEQAAMLKKGQGMYSTAIAIAAPASDYWPLPWYLRKYNNVGYWSKVSDIPTAFKPDILIVSADQGDQAERCIGKNAQSNFYGIRPGSLLILFVPRQ